MARSPDDRQSIVELLDDLENAAHVPSKQRAVKISGLVDRICAVAYSDGLPNTSLNRLIDIITLPNELDQASVGNLIKNLYPASKVVDTIVIKVVGSLGHGRAKPSFAAQGALLKWLVLVYDVLENQKLLSQLYAVMFNLLDTMAIRSQLCHVLSLITRRKHVRLFRIQVLMEMTRQSGNDPPLVGLMRVYKDYYPDIIVSDVTSGRASVFTHPNPEWRQRLGEIQDAHLQRTQDGLPPEQRAFRVTRRGANSAKRSKSSVIPQVQTSHAQESSTTLEEIENVSDFIERLEKIELPNQLVAVMGDPLLQKLLQLKSSDIILRRLDNWLLAFFEEQLEISGYSETKVLAMLSAVRDYTQYTKKLPPSCLAYLKSMMESWNGTTGREIILDLLAYTPIGPFKDLYQSIFQPLESAILDETTEGQLSLLLFYNDLLRRWTVALLAQSKQPLVSDGSTLSLLTTHASNLAHTILQCSSEIKTHSAILTFYETTASLISHASLRSTVRIMIPPASLVYLLFFTSSLHTTSRLCAVLALYKRAFEVTMAPQPAVPTGLEQQTYPKDYVNRFNGFLMDICNCLWRNRAFNASDVNALGCLLPPEITPVLSKYLSGLNTSLSLHTLFSLSYSSVFCLFSISYVRELEDGEDHAHIEIRHAGPVTQKSLVQLGKEGGLKLLWQDYRLGVLHYLEKRGINGVSELMYNTMKHLMTARNGKA